MIALSIFGMALAGVPNAFATEEDVEEVVVTATRFQGFALIGGWGVPSGYEPYTAIGIEVSEEVNEAIENECVPKAVALAGAIAVARYVCGRLKNKHVLTVCLIATAVAWEEIPICGEAEDG